MKKDIFAIENQIYLVLNLKVSSWNIEKEISCNDYY